MADTPPESQASEILSQSEVENILAAAQAESAAAASDPAGAPQPPLSGAGEGGSRHEVLSQSEIERIVAQVQAEEAAAVVLKSGGRKSRVTNEVIQPFDFRQPAFLTASELRRLRLRHEEFIRSMAAHLSSHLRLEVSLQLLKLQTLSYQKYTSNLANPSHITLFKLEPLRGVCLLDMAPRLGLTLVDRLLGGPAQAVNASGELSDIDIALLDQVTQLILNEWCQLWQKNDIARPVILSHENSGRFLNSSPHDTVMLVLSLECGLGDCVEPMQLAFPFLTIESLVRQADAALDAGTAQGAAKPAAPRWNPSFDEVTVRLSAQYHGLEVSARDLANLKCGDVLMLSPNCFDQVDVQLEDVPRFHARLGTSGKHRAAQLTERLKQ